MSERNPPLWIDGGCYSAEDLRAMFAGLGGCDSGVVDGGDLYVTAVGGMVLRVAPGGAWIPGSEQAGQGSYFVDAPSPTDVTITTSSTTNPRVDLVIARVYDPTYGGTGEPRWAIEVVTGTPAGTPVPPAAPESSLVLTRVNVAAGAAALTQANLVDQRVLCSGANSTPTGVILPFGGTVAPNGFLLCHGQPESRTLYASLYNVIGDSYGAGDGSTTFNVPNGQGVVMAGLDPAQGEFAAMGLRGGTKALTMPWHNHGGSTQAADRWLGHQHSVSLYGGGHAHWIDLWSGGENALHRHGTARGGDYGFIIQGGPGSGVAGITTPADRDLATEVLTGPEDEYHAHQTVGGTHGADHAHGGATGAEPAPDHLHGIYAEGGSGNNLPPYLVTQHIIRF